jgi:murein DD-endopeptidase MepM/ murein hydrolase activator NlpD
VNDSLQQNKKAIPLLALATLVVFAFPSPHVHAWAGVSSFTERVRSIFIQKEEDRDLDEATTQTMALFKPNVVESTSALLSVEVYDDEAALRSVSGSLRLSTEEVDFPVSDEISVYEVKKGDTIQDVAKLFGVSVNTIMWANSLSSRTLKPGDTIIILPVTGIKLTIKKGDTVKSLARKYKADTTDIAQYNGISEDGSLAVGDTIIIPDGEIEAVQPVKPKTTTPKKPKILNFYANITADGFLARPVIGGRKTQGIHGHNGIDIAATPGTPVVASGNGRVIVSRLGGYNGGYGNMVIISHDGGVQTVYAHLREVNVSQGDVVAQGQVIGGVGNTGRSTGPHLHFEVRGAKNPF